MVNIFKGILTPTIQDPLRVKSQDLMEWTILALYTSDSICALERIYDRSLLSMVGCISIL